MHPLPEQISAERMADDLWRLVNIESPTGNEREAAFLFAAMLEQAGARVEIDERIHNSPNVIGRPIQGRQQQNHQVNGLAIDAVEVNSASRPRDRSNLSSHGRVLCMRKGYALTDPCRPEFLAPEKRGHNAVRIAIGKCS